MAGDFNSDFNSDFSRVAVTAALAAPLSLNATFEAVHGVAGELAASLGVNAAFVAEHPVEVVGTLVAELHLVAELQAVHPRARGRGRGRPGGVGRRRRVLFPAPEPPQLKPPYIAPVIGQLAARLSLNARLTAFYQRPIELPAPLPVEARLLAGLIVNAHFEAEALPRDESEDELVILLLAAA